MARGQLDLALDVTSSIAESDEREEAQELILAALVRAGQVSRALHLAQSIDGQEQQTTLLTAVGTALAEAGQLDMTLEVAGLIDTHPMRDQVFSALATQLVNTSRLDLAHELVNNGTFNGTKALEVVAPALAQGGQLDAGLDIVRSRIPAARQIRQFRIIAEALLADGREAEACGCLTEALNKLVPLGPYQDQDVRNNLLALMSRFRDPAVVLDCLHGHLPSLTRRDDLVALLPAAAPLIATHPPLMEELLDGFDWVDRVLKKWLGTPECTQQYPATARASRSSAWAGGLHW